MTTTTMTHNARANVPRRTELDLLIDDLWRRVESAQTAESRRVWGARYHQAIAQRNAQRTPEEIAQLERVRGLRA